MQAPTRAGFPVLFRRAVPAVSEVSKRRPMWSEQEQRRSPLAGSACPELAKLLDGLERRDKAFVEHARTCPHCAGEWALYKGFMLPDVDEADGIAGRPVQQPAGLRRVLAWPGSLARRIFRYFGGR